MEESRDGANGFKTIHTLAEIVDNGFDAGGSTVRIAAIQRPDDYTVIYYDKGTGVADLMSLYSCSKQVIKKNNGKRGLKNYGHRGSTGSMRDRQEIVYISRPATSSGAAARCSTLKVSFATMFEAIDRAKTSAGRDLNSVDARQFFQSTEGSGWTEETREIVQSLIVAADYEPVRADLSAMLENTEPQYFLMIVRYLRQPHNLEEEIRDAIRSFRLSYHKALEAGRRIEFYAKPNPPVLLSLENAVDPLGSNPRMGGEIEIRLPVSAFDVATGIIKDDRTGILLRFTIGDDDYETQYWLTDTTWSKFDRRTASGATSDEPEAWAAMKPVATMKYAFSVVSKDDEEYHKKTLGTLLDKVGLLRGVYLVYIDHCLGMPLYNLKWESRNNAGGVRFEMVCDNQIGAEHFWRIQNQKHSSDFDQLHPMMQAFLNLVLGRTIIDKYSHYKACHGDTKNSSPGVIEWDLDEFCELLENPKSDRPAPTPVSPTIIAHIADPRPNISTETIVPQHKRITSKSQNDVLQQLAELNAALTGLKFSSVPQNTHAHPDMTKHYKEAASLLTFVQSLTKNPHSK